MEMPTIETPALLLGAIRNEVLLSHSPDLQASLASLQTVLECDDITCRVAAQGLTKDIKDFFQICNATTFSLNYAFDQFDAEVAQIVSGPDDDAKARKYSLDVSTKLNRWFSEHQQNPYPFDEEKKELCEATGLTLKQLNNVIGVVCKCQET
ncbi:hypothetical protein HK101_007868 [Irineochytrium annulatum]|nr:hypothetical protein HK101_007868 [Irineochytrium annulatum]